VNWPPALIILVHEYDYVNSTCIRARHRHICPSNECFCETFPRRDLNSKILQCCNALPFYFQIRAFEDGGQVYLIGLLGAQRKAASDWIEAIRGETTRHRPVGQRYKPFVGYLLHSRRHPHSREPCHLGRYVGGRVVIHEDRNRGKL